MPSFCQLSSWQSFLWSWLCCCCCLCGLLAGAADSRTFRVSIADVAAAWQSGGASSSSCVSESQFSEQPWSLGRVADSDGFHWLLLKLVREVRVLSVTVHAAGGSGLQVLLGSWLPPEAFAADSNCRAVLRHNSTTLSSCGWAGVSAGSTAEFFVQCNRTAIPLPTEHILIRQRPGSSFSSFNGLDITEEANHAYFSTCAAASSKTERCKPGLKHLKLGDSVLVNVSLLCPMDSGRQPSCRITSQAGEQWNGNLTVLKPEAWNFLLLFNAVNSLFDWVLLCEFSCHNSTRSASTRLQLDVKPKDLQLNFNDSGLQIGGRQFWVEGRSVNFSVTSDGGFPVTLIACRVCNCLEQIIGPGEQQVTYKCQKYSTYEIKRKLVKLETKSTSSCHFCLNVVHEFRLDVSSSLENSCIFCGQELSSNESHSAYNTKSETTKQTLKIPPLVYPCEARISLSPGSYWLEGSVVSVTVNSTSSNWPFHTSYHCSVLTQQGEETMRSLSKSVASESFTGHASRRWGHSARIRCSVSQPGLGCERNESINAPPVYYRPAATVQQLSPVLCHGFTAHFRLNVTDLGNPEASFVSCTFAGTFSESRNKVVQGGFAFSFNVTLEDSGKVISCRMKQNLSGADAAEFNSSIINLQKQPESTWTATQTVGVWEGDVISVNVSSVSDSPQVKHQCWLQLKTKLQSEKISLENISESNGQSAFRITARRSMHGSKLVCIANHPCSSRADQLVQNVSVFYQPQVTFKLHGPNQSHAFVEVSVSEANPKPSKMCSMNLSDSSVSVPKLLPVENGTILKISLQQCQAPSHVRIVCHVNQTAAGKNVLNRTEHSFNCSELTHSTVDLLDLSDSKISGTLLVISIRVKEEGWISGMKCSLLTSSGTRHNVSICNCDPTSTGRRYALFDLRRPEQSVNVSCSVEQRHRTIGIYSVIVKSDDSVPELHRLLLVAAVLLSIGLGVVVSISVCRRSCSCAAATQESQSHPAAIPLVSTPADRNPISMPSELNSVRPGLPHCGAERDPNTIYYEENSSQPPLAPATAFRDPNTVYYEENSSQQGPAPTGVTSTAERNTRYEYADGGPTGTYVN